MEAKQCCVPGCCGKQNLLQFPNPETYLNNFKAWISFIGVKASKYSNDYQKIYEKYKNSRVCNFHFTPILYEGKNGERVVMYTVPKHYGPAFWKENRRMPIVSLNRAELQKEIEKRKSLSSQKKEGENPIGGLSDNTFRRSPRILRKRNISRAPKVVETVDLVESADDSDSASIADSETQRNSQNERTPSSTDIKKPKISNTDTEVVEMETDSEEACEVEYMDSDTDKTDCEENTPPEIEYFDMDKLEAEDNQQITTTNSIKDDMIKRTSEATKAQSNEIQETTKPSTIEMPKPITDSDISIITVFDSEVNKTYERKSKIVSAQRIETVNNVSTEISRVAKDNYVVTELVTENIDAGTVVKDITQESASQMPKDTKQPFSNFIPVLEVDGKTGCVSIKIVESEPAAEIHNSKLGEEPTREVNKASLLPQRTKPSISQPFESNALKEFMSKHNLKPIDTKTPLHKHVSTTITQLEREYDVKLPGEITIPNVQKLLAANTSQHPTDSKKTKTTNVYVLDSKGSILVKEQLDSKSAPQLQKPVATVNGTRQNPVPQVTEYKSHKFVAELSTESALQRELSKTKRSLSKLKYKLKVRVKMGKDLLTHPKFVKVTNKMSRIARMITTIQLRETLKNKKGRRFTDEEKELANSIFEQCPSAYKYMRKMGFVLPNHKTLFRCDIKADVDTVINRNDTITKLKAKIKKMPDEHRLCTLLFDEKLISPSNRNKQVITAIGIQGEETEASFEADHALIFMVKGILQNYQEPVSYTFSFGPTNAADLAIQITRVISDLQSIGYKVLATICDHADSNRMAIKILTDEARSDDLSSNNYIGKVFKVNTDEIIPIYDPPHLLKGIRNHLISKQLTFAMGGQMKRAQWQHLEMILKENPNYNGERLIAKLTENHVYPSKQGITKTKYACQIFSQTIATYMGYLADKDILPPESSHTADLLLFFDQLFDSLNGYLSNTQRKVKLLLSAVKSNSVHHKKWAEAIRVLKTMKFLNDETVVTVADIDCWIWTLEGFMLLMRKLFVEYKADSVWMRNLNQDVLERLFRTEVNPTPLVRAKNTARHKKVLPGHYTGEVVTQKVIKAINRINREENVE